MVEQKEQQTAGTDLSKEINRSEIWERTGKAVDLYFSSIADESDTKMAPDLEKKIRGTIQVLQSTAVFGGDDVFAAHPVDIAEARKALQELLKEAFPESDALELYVVGRLFFESERHQIYKGTREAENIISRFNTSGMYVDVINAINLGLVDPDV